MIGKLQEADHYWNETGAHLIAAASSWNGANECLPVVIVGVRVFGQETLLYRNLQAGFSSRVERQCSKQLFPTWEYPPRVFNDTVLKTQPLQEQLLSGWQPDPGLSGIGEGGQEVVVIVKLHRCGPSFTQGPFHSYQQGGPWSGCGVSIATFSALDFYSRAWVSHHWEAGTTEPWKHSSCSVNFGWVNWASKNSWGWVSSPGLAFCRRLSWPQAAMFLICSVFRVSGAYPLTHISEWVLHTNGLAFEVWRKPFTFLGCWKTAQNPEQGWLTKTVQPSTCKLQWLMSQERKTQHCCPLVRS